MEDYNEVGSFDCLDKQYSQHYEDNSILCWDIIKPCNTKVKQVKEVKETKNTKDTRIFGLCNSPRILEIKVDNTVSDYMVTDWEGLLGYARSLVKQDRAEDLVMDVYMSIRSKEQAGWQFKREFNGHESSMEEHVRGKIKLYSMNKAYKDSGWVMLASMQEKNIAEETVNASLEASEPSTETEENIIDHLIDLEYNIKELLALGSIGTIELKTVLANPEILIDTLESRINVDKSLFGNLVDRLRRDSTIRESFISVLIAFKSFPEIYESTISGIEALRASRLEY